MRDFWQQEVKESCQIYQIEMCCFGAFQLHTKYMFNTVMKISLSKISDRIILASISVYSYNYATINTTRKIRYFWHQEVKEGFNSDQIKTSRSIAFQLHSRYMLDLVIKIALSQISKEMCFSFYLCIFT